MTGGPRRRRSRGCTAAIVLGAGVALLASPALARVETIRFVDVNREPSSVIGFELYVGANSGEYTIVVDIGVPPLDADGARILALDVGDEAIVYVAVSAYDSEGGSSELSNEIVRGPPGETVVGEEMVTWYVADYLDCASPASDDIDDDAIPDACDNCTFRPNPDQRDADAGADDHLSLPGLQRYGDVCDADLDNDGIVGARDFLLGFGPCWGKRTSQVPSCSVADFDANGFVGAMDFVRFFLPSYGRAPGPGYDVTL